MPFLKTFKLHICNENRIENHKQSTNTLEDTINFE